MAKYAIKASDTYNVNDLAVYPVAPEEDIMYDIAAGIVSTMVESRATLGYSVNLTKEHFNDLIDVVSRKLQNDLGITPHSTIDIEL